MAQNVNRYLNNLSQDTSFGPSPALWGFNGQAIGGIADLLESPMNGRYLMEQFTRFTIPNVAYPLANAYTGPVGDWSAYMDPGTTIADAKQQGGGITISNNGVAGKQVNLSHASSVFRFIDGSGNNREYMIFECGVSVSSIVAGAFDAFLGLSDVVSPAAGTPITATSGSLDNTKNLIGFQRVAGTGNDWSFVYQRANVTAVYPLNLQTLVNTITGSNLAAAQFVKLGFIFDASPGNNPVFIFNPTTNQTASAFRRPLLRIGVNNIINPSGLPFLSSDNINTTAFPSVNMCHTIALSNQTTNPGSMTVTFLGGAQLSVY